MQFIDLQTQFRYLEDDIRNAIDSVLKHGRFIMGPEVFELEEQLAERVGVKHAITCASGTDALLMVLMAQDIGPGDCVFTSPFSFFATAEVISLLGATPVFVDIDPRTFNIDIQKLRLAIEAVKNNDSGIHPLPAFPQSISSLKPKAVIPVDIFGLPADYTPLQEIADSEGLFVLEDAAQSFGGSYLGRPTGSLGHAGATSFFPAKPLGCYGDGGAAFTDDDVLAEKLRSIRNHGEGSGKYDHVRLGLNSRLDTIQAAVLLQKLKVYSEEQERRQKIAEKYTQLLAGYEVQHIPKGYTSAWAQFSVIVDDRDKIQSELQKLEIPSMVYYPKGLHRQDVFKFLQYRPNDFGVTEEVCRHIVSLPMHPYLDDESVERICSVFPALNG